MRSEVSRQKAVARGQKATDKRQKAGDRFTLCLLLVAFCFLFAACSPATTVASAPSVEPTKFIQTRVAEILTSEAGHAVSATPPPPPAETSPAPAPATLAPRPTSTTTATRAVLPTAGATITKRPSPVVTTTPITPCATATCFANAAHFWLIRPIPTGYTDYVDRSYPYASTQSNVREPHHGVEFFNRKGTPVIVAGEGQVVVAGDDTDTAYGPATVFYGNLVVVKLDRPYNGRPVFTLYGHLQEVLVEVGDRVTEGDELGAVGETGVALGPHLHFEVRVGQNDYESSRNPELWITPYLYNDKPWGAIAGRVVDTQGNLLREWPIVIRPEKIVGDAPVRSRYITTYALDEAYPLNSDDALQETFAIGDIPPGEYSVSASTTKTYKQMITVKAGEVAWVELVVNPPLPTEVPPSPTP